jgi:hypothetical protein
MTQRNEKKARPGFFQSVQGQVALVVATLIVMAIFVWTYIL